MSSKGSRIIQSKNSTNYYLAKWLKKSHSRKYNRHKPEGLHMSVALMDSIWDYFVGIGPGMLLSAVLIMIIATMLTLSFRITSAAMKNPADSLRYE
jgi:hypothetical protein